MSARLIMLSLLLCSSLAHASKRPVSAECRALRRMQQLGSLSGTALTAKQYGAVTSLQLAICLGGVVVVPQTRSWPGGQTAKNAHGQWFYPNGQRLYSPLGEWQYANGQKARDQLGVWRYPDGSLAMRRSPDEQWFRPGDTTTALSRNKVLLWATKRLAPRISARSRCRAGTVTPSW